MWIVLWSTESPSLRNSSDIKVVNQNWKHFLELIHAEFWTENANVLEIVELWCVVIWLNMMGVVGCSIDSTLSIGFLSSFC